MFILLVGNSTFNTKPESPFACRSFDNKTVSTIPDIETPTCGSKDIFFKYGGVFVDREFRNDDFHQLDIIVKFQTHFQNDADYEGIVLYEFGMATGSVNTKYLIDSSIFTLTASSCRDIFNVCLTIGNGMNKVQLLNNMFVADGNSDNITGKFSIRIRPEKRTLSFISKTFENILLYKFTNVKMYSSLFGVFALYEREKISASISLSLGDNIQFDRSTLHPSLYISSDNKTVSNRPTSNTKLYNRKDNRYIYAVPLSVGSIEDIYSVVNIKFTHHVGLKHGTKLFEIRLGSNKKGKRVDHFKFECVICRITSYWIFRGTGYCLQTIDGLSIIVPDFRIIMHYQIKMKRLSLYIADTTGARCYYIYTNKKFHRVLPTFYIGKMDSTDVTAFWTNNIRLYEAAFISFLDWFNS